MCGGFLLRQTLLEAGLDEFIIQEFLLEVGFFHADLHRIAAEMELIFPKEFSEPLNTFISAYGKILKALCGYLVIWNQMSGDMFPEMKNWTLGEKADHLGEERYRKEVFAALEQLERAYQAVVSQQTEEKIRELIRL